MGGKGRPARKADNLTAICEPIVQKMWDPRRLTTLWPSTASYRDSFTFYSIRRERNIDKIRGYQGGHYEEYCLLDVTIYKMVDVY
jgi:hypothetical protein